MPTRAVAGGTKPLPTMEFTCFRCRRFASIIRHFPYGLRLEPIQTRNSYDCNYARSYRLYCFDTRRTGGPMAITKPIKFE